MSPAVILRRIFLPPSGYTLTSLPERGIIPNVGVGIAFGQADLSKRLTVAAVGRFLFEALQIEFVIFFFSDSLDNQIVFFFQVMQASGDRRFRNFHRLN